MAIEVHRLKTDPSPFQATLDGIKTFEIRRADRTFKVGDLLILQETKFSACEMSGGEPLEYTGRELVVKVTYFAQDLNYVPIPGYCIMGVQLV